MLGDLRTFLRKAVIKGIRLIVKRLASFSSHRPRSHELRLCHHLSGPCHLFSHVPLTLRGHAIDHSPEASDTWDAIPILRSRLRCAVLAQDVGGSISDEVPVSQYILPGSKLRGHSKADNKLVLDNGWDEEKVSRFNKFF